MKYHIEKKSDSSMREFGFLEFAMRQNDLAYEVKEYLKKHPNAAVVNMGCGLDNTGSNFLRCGCVLLFSGRRSIRNQVKL